MPLTPEERAKLEAALVNVGTAERNLDIFLRELADFLDEFEQKLREMIASA